MADNEISSWNSWNWRSRPPFMYAGRIHVWDEQHPLGARIGGRDGAVNVARHIASVKLGRWLTWEEVVTFNDKNPFNTDPANITVITRTEMLRMTSNRPNKIILTCVVCGGEIEDVPSHMERRETCSIACRAIHSRKFDVEPDELRAMVWEITGIAALFGVSDKAIAKRCKKFGIDRPPPGYWTLIKQGWLHDDALDYLKKKSSGLPSRSAK